MITAVTVMKESDLQEKIVYLRGSADVPMNEDKELSDPDRIKDHSRIDSFMPTLTYLIKNNAKVVLQPGWIDRPDGVEKDKSVIPVYLYIKKKLKESGLLKGDLLMAPSDIDGETRNIADNFDLIQEKVSKLSAGQVLVLENPRFDPQYNKGDEFYAKRLAGMVDIYVADDFAQRHRPAADIVNMPKHLHRYAGIHLLDEIKYAKKISEVLDQDKRKPFVFILAGKKIKTKPGVVSKITVALSLLDRMKNIDKILVGGAVAYTFMVAEKFLDRVKAGRDELDKISKGDIKNIVGDSYIAWDQVHDQIMFAGKVLLKSRERGIEVIIPTDHTIMKNGIMKKGEIRKSQAEIPTGWMGVDIGEKTIEEFIKAIFDAGFVVMSGPVGMFDKKIPEAAAGSSAIVKALEEATKRGVVTVSAGGESTLLVNTTGVKISHASIGGGSTLEFIEKGSLHGIDVLNS
jgi:phosphoglycerate kinase